MSDNWICFKFFGHLSCKSINKLTNFCCNQSSVGYPISICVTNLVLAEISAKKPCPTVGTRSSLSMAHYLVKRPWGSQRDTTSFVKLRDFYTPNFSPKAAHHQPLLEIGLGLESHKRVRVSNSHSRPPTEQVQKVT